MLTNRSVPTDILLPHIAYRDIDDAIAWLTKAFGFTEHYRYGDPVDGAQIRAGKGWVMLHQTRPEYGKQTLTVFIEDPGTHFQKTQAAGAKIVEYLHETIYGELQYAAEDLDGHRWIFSKHARDVSPAEWGATLARQLEP